MQCYIASHVSEHNVKTAATLADEYVLIHRGDCEQGVWDENKTDGNKYYADGKWEQGSGPRLGRPKRPSLSQKQFDPVGVWFKVRS